MTESEPKSDTWCSLDTIRHLVTTTATLVVVYFLWQTHWILALVAAIPVYIVLLYQVGSLTSLLYRLAQDGKGPSDMLTHIENQDRDLLHQIANGMVDGADESETAAPAPEEQTAARESEATTV